MFEANRRRGWGKEMKELDCGLVAAEWRSDGTASRGMEDGVGRVRAEF